MSPPFPLSAQDQEEVLRHYDQGGLLAAVLDVRQRLGLGLAEANEAVRATLLSAGRLSPEVRAAVNAQVLATGAFQRSLVPYLDYGEDFFKDTREGALIIATLLSDAHEDGLLQQVTACLGVDPWDFNTHVIDPAQVRSEALGILLDDDQWAGRFNALRAAGFRFFFRMEPVY